MLEVLAAAGFYIKENAAVKTTERQVSELLPDGKEEEVYGIGIGAGSRSLFWFHSRTEIVDSGKES